MPAEVEMPAPTRQTVRFDLASEAVTFTSSGHVVDAEGGREKVIIVSVGTR